MSVSTLFLETTFVLTLVCVLWSFVCSRLHGGSRATHGPSLFGHRCTVGVLAGTHRCATESRGDSVGKTPTLVCVGVVTSCMPCARVRTSRSCATENTTTPAAKMLEMFSKVKVHMWMCTCLFLKTNLQTLSFLNYPQIFMCTHTFSSAFHDVFCSKPLTFRDGFMFFCFSYLFQAHLQILSPYSSDRQRRKCQ